jgi:hypothetical protein
MLELGLPIAYDENSGAGNCHTCGSPDHFQYDCPEFHSEGGRPGDWTCSCGSVNFARRTECYTCKNPREGGGSGGGRSWGGGGGGGASTYGGQAKPGDWTCQCGTLNFARRTSCYTCNSARAGPSSPPPRASPSATRKPGDWDCPCGCLNFASRFQCYSCGKPKANQRSGGGGGYTGEKKVGDWECGGCGKLNFARRTRCFGCNQSQ